MKKYFWTMIVCTFSLTAFAQDSSIWLSNLPQAKDYVQKSSTSYDLKGANADWRAIAPGATLTLLDTSGPGLISQLHVTIHSEDRYHLKALVLRMYWDGESTPSVETPIGDFFGLGLGDYFQYQSLPLSVASDRALNCFFPMPYQKHARITVTNESTQKVDEFFYNIDYRAYSHPLSPDALYFHAQYRQATPLKGSTKPWTADNEFDNDKNLNGEGNYTWMEATGRGHFVGVTMSLLQNQDDWWGEGDDMFFVDGETTPSINGTGAEDYFLGSNGFGGRPFSFDLFGAPVVQTQGLGSRTSLYRFHLESPVTFTKSLRATIEHGNANHRSDNYFSVAYWYQTEPHAAFPPLPPFLQRIPRLYSVGGPTMGRPDCCWLPSQYSY